MLEIGVWLSHVPFPIPIPRSAAVAAVPFLGPAAAANYAISDPALGSDPDRHGSGKLMRLAAASSVACTV